MSTQHLEITVTGMHCGSCAGKVRGALEGLGGVTGAEVDHETGHVRIALDGTVAVDDLEFEVDEAIEGVGYKVATP